jgi:hypothetical protein
MQTIIVGHHSRIEWVGQLQAAIPGAAAIIDNANEGALKGHIKALQVAREVGERCLILEDDAIPVEGFESLSEHWCDSFPDRLISFYLGTGRPAQWQMRVDDALEHTTQAYIVLPRLIHGVCYSLPVDGIGRVLDRLHRFGDADEGADFLIGRAWGRDVVYPVESLVEHRDAESVERHPDGQPRIERRVARNLAGPLMYER